VEILSRIIPNNLRLKILKNKRILENFISLSLLQLFNYILPLVTIPYLLRVIGPDKYGIIAFGQALIQYFIIITDYGFNLTATRDIARKRTSIDDVSKIVSTVLMIKSLIAIICLIVFLMIIISFNKFSKEFELYIYFFGMVVGNVLFPVWFFQGMERMKYITAVNFMSKFIFTLAIFIFIKDVGDYKYVALLNSLGSILAGFIALFIIIKVFKVKLIKPNYYNMVCCIKDGWYIFVSSISINLYKMNNVFILGLFAEDLIVGYFAIAKKLIDFVNQISSMVSQTVFPYVSNRIHEIGFSKITTLLKTVLYFIIIITFCIGMIFFMIPDKIMYLVSGGCYHEAIWSLRVLSFVPLITGINVPAVQILLGYSYDRLFSAVVVAGGIINLIINFILVPFIAYKGSCLAVILSELFVTIGLYFAIIHLKKKHVL